MITTVRASQGFQFLKAVVAQAQPGDEIQLIGQFDFGSDVANNSLVITKALTITGLPDTNGQMPSVLNGGGGTFMIARPDGTTGTWLLGAIDVQAKGFSVRIRGLQFVNPKLCAIQVWAVHDLEIAGCTVNGVIPAQPPKASFNTALGIAVGTSDPKLYARATSGVISIVNNTIDVTAQPPDQTLGILLNNAGIDNFMPIVATVAGNTVKNATALGIDCRDVIGKIDVGSDGGNSIVMSAQGVGPPPLHSGVRCLVGSEHAPCRYVVRGNSIKCNFKKAAGIRLQGKSQVQGPTGVWVPGNPIAWGIVEGNSISMSTAGDIADNLNAGIEIRGNAVRNKVINNTISGQAVAALSVVLDSGNSGTQIVTWTPRDNVLESNYHQNSFSTLEPFSSSLADIIVQAGAINTQIVAPSPFLPDRHTGAAGTYQDQGKLMFGTKVAGDYSSVPTTVDYL